jgi:alanine dehydrogenase
MLPQEQVMEVGAQGKKSLFIGIPKESRTSEEHRVPLTPASRGRANGAAGTRSPSSAEWVPVYSSRTTITARRCHARRQLRGGLQGRPHPEGGPPTQAEIEMLRHKQILISALQMGPCSRRTRSSSMMEKRMTAVAWDFIKDREGIYPIIRAMGEIAGNTCVQIASGIPQHRQGGKASCSAASAVWHRRKWWSSAQVPWASSPRAPRWAWVPA